MIPKKIHYIWFGGNSLPNDAIKYIESWKENCPDYEIIRWDESNFDFSHSRYAREAYEAKKWAFVSDYARLWILVNHGGVYMDTDVEILKPLDGFLKHKAFSGFESNSSIPTGIMACEKGFPLFSELLHDYDKRSFLLEDGSYDLSTNVVAITQKCLQHGFVPNNALQNVDGFSLYPSDWFCPKSHETGEIHITENTVAIHHFAGSWMSDIEKELLLERRKFLEKHAKIPPILGGAIVRLKYGIKSGDFSPLVEMAKLFLRERRKR